jgi:deoxyribonuclease V
VSPGHRIDVAGAVRAVLAGVRGYRLPEPTRLAHLFVNEERRKRLG